MASCADTRDRTRCNSRIIFPTFYSVSRVQSEELPMKYRHSVFRICDLTSCNRSTVNKLEGRVRGPFPTTLRQKIRQYRRIVASMQRIGSGVFQIQKKTKPSPNRECQCKQLLYYTHHIVSTLAYLKAFYLYMLRRRWQMAAMSTAYFSTCGRRHCMALECDAIRFYQPFNTLRTGLLNCLNARSRGSTFRHRASCI